MVGVELLLLQQTPLVVTGSPPSEVTSPPAVAEFTVTAVTALAVKVGNDFGVSFLQLNTTNNSIPRIPQATVEE